MTPPEIVIPSHRFGRYRVRARLGQGGMAEVFLAEAVDERGEQLKVALKLMREGVSDEAFADEADLMSMLHHPNLVRHLEVGTAFGRPFIAMEFLLGGDLGSVMAAHRAQMVDFPLAMAVHVVGEVLRALAYFHRARTRTGRSLGLVHGDVNPANVFFSGGGEVKLGDFGVAKSASLGIGPGEGITAGKLHYLSPEQTRGEKLTPKSDLFSAGIVLHELAVGYHPFVTRDPSPQAVMATIRQAKLHLPEYVDRPLAQLLRQALAPDPADRFPSAGAFAGALLHYSLDHDLQPTSGDVQGWLQGLLGIVT